MAPDAQGWRWVPVPFMVPQGSHQPFERSRGSPAEMEGGGQKVVKDLVIALHSSPYVGKVTFQWLPALLSHKTAEWSPPKGSKSTVTVTQRWQGDGHHGKHLLSGRTNHRHLVVPKLPVMIPSRPSSRAGNLLPAISESQGHLPATHPKN